MGFEMIAQLFVNQSANVILRSRSWNNGYVISWKKNKIYYSIVSVSGNRNLVRSVKRI